MSLDVGHAPDSGYRVVQANPPGSAVSVQFGVGLTTGTPGSAQGGYLVAPDLV